MMEPTEHTIEMIAVDKIRILNPRERNKRKFQEMVDSIDRVGLKKPITVSSTNSAKTNSEYGLVCGQGRLEAFIKLNQTKIPAFVIQATEEDCLIMSLVENIARRQHSSLELMQDISNLENRGYSNSEIAQKTGLSDNYVRNILHLLNNGEERLIGAVERNQIPMHIALEISNATDADVQNALTDAYERNELRGPKLKAARLLVEQRSRRGKSLQKKGGKSSGKRLTANTIVKSFKQETERQRALILKSQETERRLLFIASSLRELFNDLHFVTLLRAENLDTVPSQLAGLMGSEGN